jgi:uncharacterized protein (DUF433 family)
MIEAIEIVERGRGPQLSTSRITVQDLVPYFQRKCSYEQILEAMPVLSVAEIQVVEQYVRDNYEAVMAQDRLIRERNARRKNPPEIEAIRQLGEQKMASLRKQFKERLHPEERNGDQAGR